MLKLCLPVQPFILKGGNKTAEIAIPSFHCDPKWRKTRMHSSRMRTARSLTVSRRILCTSPSNHACPPCNHTCPPATTHPPTTTHAPQQPHMPPTNMHTPLQPRMAPVDRMTHMCKNITLPQTSFAGGKKRKECIPVGCVPTAPVAATRCQSREGLCLGMGGGGLSRGGVSVGGVYRQGGSLFPPLRGQNDKRLVKTLPSLVRIPRFFKDSIWLVRTFRTFLVFLRGLLPFGCDRNQVRVQVLVHHTTVSQHNSLRVHMLCEIEHMRTSRKSLDTVSGERLVVKR